VRQLGVAVLTCVKSSRYLLIYKNSTTARTLKKVASSSGITTLCVSLLVLFKTVVEHVSSSTVARLHPETVPIRYNAG